MFNARGSSLDASDREGIWQQREPVTYCMGCFIRDRDSKVIWMKQPSGSCHSYSTIHSISLLYGNHSIPLDPTLYEEGFDKSDSIHSFY